MFGDNLLKHLKEMSEVKRARQQMQKVPNGPAYTTKALSFKSQWPKPYDRPQNGRFNALKHHPFLAHGCASTQTNANNQKNFHKTQ